MSIYEKELAKQLKEIGGEKPLTLDTLLELDKYARSITFPRTDYFFIHSREAWLGLRIAGIVEFTDDEFNNPGALGCFGVHRVKNCGEGLCFICNKLENFKQQEDCHDIKKGS